MYIIINFMSYIKENMFFKLATILGGVSIGWLNYANDYLRFIALILSIVVAIITLYEKLKKWKK